MRFKGRLSNPLGGNVKVLRTCVSVDIGSVNLAIARVTQYENGSGKILMRLEHCVIIDLTDDDGERRDVDTLGRNLFSVLNSSDMQWMWTPASPVVVERQVDQLRANMHKKNTDGGASRPSYTPPINFAIYGMLLQSVLAHSNPTVAFDDEAWSAFEVKGIALDDPEMIREALTWVPRSGGQKFGLKDVHGGERKTETLVAAPKIAEGQFDDRAANFFESLRKPKPREDACDAYLQGYHYLQELYDLEQKEERKKTRAENAKRKRELIEEKRNAKRQRLMSSSGSSSSAEKSEDMQPQETTQDKKTGKTRKISEFFIDISHE